MGYALKQASTEQPLVFLLVLTSDHITGATGKTPTVTISKNGGAFASPAGAVTEIGNGVYKVAANATDTATLGPLWLHVTEASSDPVDDCFDVVAYDPQVAWSTLGGTAQTGDSFARIGALGAGLTAITDKTGLIPSDPADASDITAQFAALLTTAMSESYPADGATMSLAQFAYLMRSFLTDFGVSGLTVTARKIDGTTTSSTYTINDASNPTSITRAS